MRQPGSSVAAAEPADRSDYTHSAGTAEELAVAAADYETL